MMGEKCEIVKRKWWRMTLPLLFTIHYSLFTACEEAQEHTAPAIYDRDSVSMMISYGVNTLISDSGVIKYKIVTERWDVNVIKQPTRWTFEKGVFFEQFDQNFHVEAYVQADTAWYFDQIKLWHLRGRVRIRNVNGLVYQSEELYWDGLKHELYSNVFSKVTTPERTLQGTRIRTLLLAILPSSSRSPSFVRRHKSMPGLYKRFRNNVFQTCHHSS